MKYLGLITARGGSKGIPHKNIIEMAGKPLINYTIEPALEAKDEGILDELIVSTDDQEIADVSRKAGATVPFMRPDYLADDGAKSIDVVIHAVNYYLNQGIECESVVLLQPTAPLRMKEDISEAIKIFERSGADTLISCYKEDYVCDLVSYHRKGDMCVPLNPKHNKGIRRQELEDLYVRNGAIYIIKCDYLLREKNLISDTPAIYIMPKERSVNIDTMYDVRLLEWILRK